jgi:hypothetical protein
MCFSPKDYQFEVDIKVLYENNRYFFFQLYLLLTTSVVLFFFYTFYLSKNILNVLGHNFVIYFSVIIVFLIVDNLIIKKVKPQERKYKIIIAIIWFFLFISIPILQGLEEAGHNIHTGFTYAFASILVLLTNLLLFGFNVKKSEALLNFELYKEATMTERYFFLLLTSGVLICYLGIIFSLVHSDTTSLGIFISILSVVLALFIILFQDLVTKYNNKNTAKNSFEYTEATLDELEKHLEVLVHRTRKLRNETKKAHYETKSPKNNK